MDNNQNNQNNDQNVSTTETVQKKPRGFAAMSPEKRRELSRRGGVIAHQKGTAHKFDKEEAARAGQIGGRAFHRTRGRLPKANTATQENA